MGKEMVTLGIENLVNSPDILSGKKVGLIANATSTDGRLVSSVDLLHNHQGIDLTCLFGPQQGFWGETQDNMIEWKGGLYPKYNLPLLSLYGESRKPTPEILADVDILVFDVQDIGTRIYTYIWTMVLAMQACAENKKEFVVCDRPNPINGKRMEGNVSSKEFSSFVALYPLPLRHAMTCGEIANYVNGEFGVGCKLTVVPLSGWKRSMWQDDTNLPWVIPSANMPTLETANVYPGMVIFEGTNISEGRGTTRPFEFVGAPFVNGFKLAEELSKYKLAGVFLRPCIFIPTFNKYAGQNCGGVQLHVTDRKKFEPVKTAVAILKTIREMHPEEFKWSQPPYEYEFKRPPIDMIFGTDWIRKALEAKHELEQIVEKTIEELKEFDLIRRKYLMYE